MTQIDTGVLVGLVVSAATALGTVIAVLFRSLVSGYEARLKDAHDASDARMRDKDERITDLLAIIDRLTGTAERAVETQERLAHVVAARDVKGRRV